MKAKYFALAILLIAARMVWVSGMDGLVFAAKLFGPLLIVVVLASFTHTRLLAPDGRSWHDPPRSRWWRNPRRFWMSGNIYHND